MHLKINGTKLFFDVVGSSLQPTEQTMKLKPTLIALHGGPGIDHSSLRPWLDPLGEVAQVIYLDLRGNGRSDRQSSEYYQIGIMADDIAAFSVELGIEKPIVLGHSFGSSVALSLSIRHPNLLGGLILCAATPAESIGWDLDCLERVAGKELREVAARLSMDQGSEEEMHRFGEETFPFYWYQLKPQNLTNFLGKTIFNQEIGKYMVKRLKKEYDVRSKLASITIPALVLHGRYDWVYSVRGAEEIALKMPHAEFYILEHAAHMIGDDEPEESIDIIRAFLIQGPDSWDETISRG